MGEINWEPTKKNEIKRGERAVGKYKKAKPSFAARGKEEIAPIQSLLSSRLRAQFRERCLVCIHLAFDAFQGLALIPSSYVLRLIVHASIQLGNFSPRRCVTLMSD